MTRQHFLSRFPATHRPGVFDALAGFDECYRPLMDADAPLEVERLNLIAIIFHASALLLSVEKTIQDGITQPMTGVSKP